MVKGHTMAHGRNSHERLNIQNNEARIIGGGILRACNIGECIIIIHYDGDLHRVCERRNKSIIGTGMDGA